MEQRRDDSNIIDMNLYRDARALAKNASCEQSGDSLAEVMSFQEKFDARPRFAQIALQLCSEKDRLAPVRLPEVWYSYQRFPLNGEHDTEELNELIEAIDVRHEWRPAVSDIRLTYMKRGNEPVFRLNALGLFGGKNGIGRSCLNNLRQKTERLVDVHDIPQPRSLYKDRSSVFAYTDIPRNDTAVKTVNYLKNLLRNGRAQEFTFDEMIERNEATVEEWE